MSRDKVLLPKNTSVGDFLIGLPSSGLHTNGFSLVRRVFGLDQDVSILRKPYFDGDRSLGEDLLEPHMSYLNILQPFLSRVKGLCHITGGGIFKNIPRSIRGDLTAELDLRSWSPPPLFRHIQKQGKIDDLEMYRVFNMGMGMVVIAEEKEVSGIIEHLHGSWIVGRLVESNNPQQVQIIGS